MIWGISMNKEKGLAGKQIRLVNRIKRDKSIAEEHYEITLENNELIPISRMFQTKKNYVCKETYQDGTEVICESSSLSDTGLMKSAAIMFYETLKEKAFEEIDLSTLDKKTYDLILTTLYSAIVTSTLSDVLKYKNEQIVFIQLDNQYKEKYSKYSDEELDELLQKSLSDTEFEKIKLVKDLRNKNGGNNDGILN